MIQLTELFAQSNQLLFKDLNYLYLEKDLVIAHANLTRSLTITNSNNTEFDKLILSLEHSISQSDDLLALSIIGKLNETVIGISESFDAILDLMNKTLKH